MSLPDHPVKRFVKLAGGRLLRLLNSRRYAALKAGAITGEYSGSDRWMLAALAHEAETSGQLEILHAAHRKFWTTQSAADLMITLGDERIHDLLDNHSKGIIEPLRQALREAGCDRLIEIGCGSGTVLDWFSQKFPELTELHGIDLNPGLIEACKARENPRLHFHLGDALSLVRSLARPPQALLSFGGVLEYFLETELAELFAWLRGHHAPAVVVLVEPIGADHDLSRHPESRLYGVEHSFSHNYPRILRDAGFVPRFQDEFKAGDTRFLMVIASTSSLPA